MRKRIQIGFALLFAAALGGSAWRGLTSREPSYQGKPLSAWMHDVQLQPTSIPGPLIPAAFKQAFRHMGRDAMPQIIHDLNRRDTSVQYKVCKWANDHGLVKAAPDPALTHHQGAELACMAIGPDAKGAVPALANLFKDGYSDTYTASALACIGGVHAVLVLTNMLASTNASFRDEAASQLGLCPSNAPLVVPALARALHDGNASVRFGAAFSLGDLHEEPAVAVPALVAALADTDSQVAWATCQALGKFKNQAQAAEGPLLNSLSSTDELVREMAAIALARIDSRNPSIVDQVTPTLLEAITRDSAFGEPAAQALGECGNLARPAVPTLLVYLRRLQPSERDAVVNALQSIDPDINIPGKMIRQNN